MVHVNVEAREIAKRVDAVCVVVEFKEHTTGIGHIHKVMINRVQPLQNVGYLIVMGRVHDPSEGVSILVSILDIEGSLVHGL